MSRIILAGTPVSPGIAIGNILLNTELYLHEKRFIDQDEIGYEEELIKKASQKVCSDLEKTRNNVPAQLSEYGDIISAQIELAKDPKIIQSACARIRTRKIAATWALSDTIEELCALFDSIDDSYLKERTQDIRAIGQALGYALLGAKSTYSKINTGILAARELSPADIIEAHNLAGIVTVEGGATSHTAIFARGMKVPSIVGVGRLFEEARYGELAILDGFGGLLILNPDQDELDEYKRKLSKHIAFEKKAQAFSNSSAMTIDGKAVPVSANLEKQTDLQSLKTYGAEGIGLYRTELSFLGPVLPNMEKLVAEYSQALKMAYPAQVVFRTLDIGADKQIAGFEKFEEPNAALGMRGIRFCLRHKDIFAMQLEAILRASIFGHASIMLPMVTTDWEVRAAKNLVEELKASLKQKNVDFATHIPVGVMIETPAAAFGADAIADQCDFLSIGTNDLLHYMMAIDRNNRHVAYLYDPLHPAFLRALKSIINEAHKKNIKVSVCGELAADPLGIPLLLGMGIDSLSATPRNVPSIKQIIRNLNNHDCSELVNNALNGININNIRHTLHKMLHEALGYNLLSKHIPLNMKNE